METNLAFAAFLTNRMAEQDLSVHDVAVALDVPLESLAGWIDGSSLPADVEVESLARALSLPRSLVREALRRADEAPSEMDMAAEGDVVDEVIEQLDESTHDQVVPATVVASVVVDVPSSPIVEPVARAVDLLGSPWRLIRDRIDRGRERARAPTREVSYVEDSRQRMTYQLRAVFTVGGVLTMVIILRWAMGGFGSALSDLWSTLTGAL